MPEPPLPVESPPPVEAPAPGRKPAVKFILLTLLLDVLGFGLLIPVAPHLIQQLQPAGHDEKDAAHVYGLLIATYAALQFVFSPVLGCLSDRFGRRPVVLISLFGTGIDFFAQAFSPTLTILFVTRAINGISGANITACNAYVADVTPPHKRAAAFGMIGAAFGIGFIFGPLLGGVLAAKELAIPGTGLVFHGNIRYPFYAAGGLTLLNWLYGYFVLPESLPTDRRRPFNLLQANPLGALTRLARYPTVWGLAGALFLLHLAMFALHSTWVLYTAHRYQWTELETGLSLALVGVGAAVVQGGLARRIIPALGEKRSLLLGIAIGVAAYVGYGSAPSDWPQGWPRGWMIYVVIVLASLGGIAGPACQALITNSVSPKEQGEVQGALMSLQCVANIGGPLIGTAAFAYFISREAPVYLPGASYYVSALLAAMGLGVAAWAMRGMSPAAHGVAPPAGVSEG